MATNEPISGLPHNPGVSPGDKVEVLDVSNTSNQATGENTYALVSELAAAIGGGSPFAPAGPGHAAGTVPDPGATAHATPYVLGDDGTFHPMLGSGVSYSGGGYTFSGGTGGAGTVTQITATAPLTGGVITGIGSIGLGTVPVNLGGTNLTALPTANQVLGVNAGATAYEGKTLAAGTNITITPTPGVLTIAASGGGGAPGGSAGDGQWNNAGAFAGGWIQHGSGNELILPSIAVPTISGNGQMWNDSARKAICSTQCGLPGAHPVTIWQQLGAGTPVTNIATAQSVMGGGSPAGSLAFPANSLLVGKIIRLRGFGSITTTGAPDLTMQLTLTNSAGYIVLSKFSTMAVVTGNQWLFDAFIQVRSIGAGGTAMGGGNMSFVNNVSGATFATLFALGGTGSVTTARSIDTTAILTLDMLATWSVAATGNSVQVLGAWLTIEG